MPSRTLTQQDIGFFLKQADKKPHLTEWEEKFLESIRELHSKNKPLSEKQEEHLERIALED